jgi:hypothetical protein
LRGPRVYFTSLDYSISDERFAQGLSSLKLQAILKQKIVVPASSLFHDKWFQLVQNDPGFKYLITSGAILPAIRDNYDSVRSFFDDHPTYSSRARDFYTSSVRDALHWSLDDTTEWFSEKLVASIGDPQSISRQFLLLPEHDIQKVIGEINEARAGPGMFTRKAAMEILSNFPIADQSKVSGLLDLLYGISGAKAVNAEGHFPQFLFNFEAPGATLRLDDDAIFWDYFVGGIMESLNTLCRLDTERMATLSFSDIVGLRNGTEFSNFSDKFDQLARLAKASVPINDEDKLILNCSEILEVGSSLKSTFFNELKRELEAQKLKGKLSGIYETTNTVVSIGSMIAGGPVVGAAGVAFGLLSSFNSSPVAARIFGPSVQAKIADCVAIVKNRVSRMSGLPSGDKTALVDMYRRLVLHGID